MKKLIALFCLMTLVIVPTIAQDDDESVEFQPDADPTFAVVPMNSGFVPDPWIVTVLGGGPLRASDLDLGDGCLGNIAPMPDVTLEWTEDATTPVRVFFVSADDTTLVIRDPEGNYLCNDDSGLRGATALDPAIQLSPVEGTYSIWVGTYRQDDQLSSGYLMITEFAETYPGRIITSLFGEIVEQE